MDEILVEVPPAFFSAGIIEIVTGVLPSHFCFLKKKQFCFPLITVPYGDREEGS